MRLKSEEEGRLGCDVQRMAVNMTRFLFLVLTNWKKKKTREKKISKQWMSKKCHHKFTVEQQSKFILLLWGKSGLDFLNLLSTHLESLGQHIVRHGWWGSKQAHRNRLGSRQLAVKSRYDGSRDFAVVLLEVDQPLWEHKDLPFLNGLGNESVGGGDEPHIQLAFKHEHHLCSTRVSVGWVETTWCVVDAGERDAKGVETRNLLHISTCYQRPHGVVGQTRFRQAVEEEIRCSYVCRVLTAEPIHLYTWSTIQQVKLSDHFPHQFD